MTDTRTDYREAAHADAWATADEYEDEMVRQWRDDGEVSNDLLHDYPNGDEWHHAEHVDRDYSLTEAAAVLDQLREYEETDSGLWEGLEPRRAIAVQAAYTYGAAVYDIWRLVVVDEINGFLEALDDSLPEDADDETKAAVGEKLIRLFVILGDDRDHATGEEGQLIRAAWSALQQGDATAAGALADYYGEHDAEYKAKRIRKAVGIG